MNIPIISTTDYKKFKILEVNRAVNRKHIDKLKKAIQKKNMLHLNPIICDGSHNIIDGQHRYIAAKELGLEIYYLIDAQVMDVDIASLNSNKNNWSAKDYIEYYSKKGIESYLTIKKLIAEFPKVSYPVALELLNNSKWGGSDFREGNYVANNYESARQILFKAKDFDFCNFNFDQRFLRALKQCIETGEYNHEKMMVQVKKDSGMMRFKKCYFHDDYILMLEDIYNYKQQTEIANFRLTKAKRERIEAKKNKSTRPKIKTFSKTMYNDRVSPADIKKTLSEEKEKTIPVKIDAKTTIMVKPGTDIKKLKAKYKNRNTLHEA